MVHFDVEGLTDDESTLLQSQIDILLDKEIQINILTELLSLYPELENSFSMVSGAEAQGAFLLRMVKKGYAHIINKSYQALYDIFARHPKYGIKQDYLTSSFPIILVNVLQHNSINLDIQEQSENVWKKSNNILSQIIKKAYYKPSAKEIKKNRNRISRSMSVEDIECVVSIWDKYVIATEKDKKEVGRLLGQKLVKTTKIYEKFQRFNIDVFQQSAVIIDMLNKTIAMLQRTDELIPFLQALGEKHGKMQIEPQLLALMKKIVLDLIKQILAFQWNKSIKESWNKVLTFIVGMMINSAKKTISRKSTVHSTGSMRDSDGKDGNINHGDADIDDLELMLTPQVIANCQSTWKYIESVIDSAVKVFYADLITNTKPEIRQLFSKSNMAEQSMRLVRAIGSTVALLDDTETLIPILQELGKRHVYYNVRPEYFKYVKRCWFKMLKQALSIRWNKSIKKSWQITWHYMTFYMKSSLEDALLLYVPPDPVTVNFKVLINHIDRVKVNELSFFGDIWFAAYSGDNPSQSYAFGDGAIIDKDKEGKSIPFGGIRCLNAMETTEKYRDLNEAYIRYFEEDDTWYLRGNIVGTFAQLFDLHAYPFDVHNIEFIFALNVDDTIAIFNEEQLNVRLMPFKLDSMAGCDYNVYQPQITLIENSAIKGGSSSGKRYTHCKVIIPISRKYTHYIYDVVVPLLMIDLVSFSVYFTELTPITQRLIISMTLLLTLFAFKWSIANSLPPTPYLTLTDHIFNSAYLLCALHICGLCLVNTLKDSIGVKKCELINWLIALITLILFIIIHTAIFFKAKYFVSLYPKQEKYAEGQDALVAIAKSALNSPSMKQSRANSQATSMGSLSLYSDVNDISVQVLQQIEE